MTRAIMTTLAALALGILSTGCMSRAIDEGLGVATGASGKVVASTITPNLTLFKGLRVEQITVAADVPAPSEVPGMIRADFVTVGAARGLASEGQPALVLSAQIVHYETAGMVDTAIGPLAEMIVRAKLTDAQTGRLDQGSLVGRSKATSSSSPKDLSAGVGKALDKWLKAGGLKKAGEKEKE